MSKVFMRRPVWLAWYPLRGRRCTFGPDEAAGGWHFSVAVGPLYMGLGPGRPLP
jgi:hypothetical protein